MGQTARIAGAVVAVVTLAAATASAQADLAGQWHLDREQSQLPREVGFGMNWQTGGPTDLGGGRGRPDTSGATRNFVAPRESAEDAARLRTLTDEVRTPSEQLTITQESSAITIAGDGWSRTFHPTGRQEVLHLAGDVPLVTTTRWEGDRLTVVYDVEENRQLRYTYSVNPAPRQLVVETKFLDHGKGDSVKRVYDPPAAAAAPANAPKPAAIPAGAPAPAAAAPARAVPSQPTSGAKADLTPGAELKGLTSLGLVVEDLGSQATACGLTRDALDKAASKPLADAGLRIVRNTDEDTYLYVNVAAATAGGACVSRYDVTLYTHTTATLPYTTAPVLVQVELLHKDGMAGGAPAANAQAVVRAVTEAVDQFVARIQKANGR